MYKNLQNPSLDVDVTTHLLDVSRLGFRPTRPKRNVTANKRWLVAQEANQNFRSDM